MPLKTNQYDGKLLAMKMTVFFKIALKESLSMIKFPSKESMPNELSQ